ncbi:MAG TPA: GNAT family N-acetyltransferase [Acidobacteriota bacterium]|nr:GNAT family N-acetyltransferase [Acidobacteriota bacterium]
MNKAEKAVIIDVDLSNVEETGFFCYMSKRTSEGYRRKLDWVKARLGEGMRIKMLQLPERGFIEYVPGEKAWRAVRANGWMVIQCLWVVGKSKGRGLGGRLVEACVEEARKAGRLGVAVVASERNWLAGRRLFEEHGFSAVDAAPPAFVLMARPLRPGPPPSFPKDWMARAARFGPGLTVIRTDQCPYLPDAVANLLAAAAGRKIKSRVVELRTAREVQRLSPSPYGTFAIVLNGKLVGYHPSNLIR